MDATELTTYVAKVIARRFPLGIPDNLLGVISDIILDSFQEGAEYADRDAMRQDVIVAPVQIVMGV